ncbi:MAG: deoxyribonuclease IV [Gammaproteobacteria bacterium]|nr:deoxyribonuclease IV [Gammaproteobacteria bacterium]
MKYIGAHVSIEGGIFNAPLRAQKIGAKAFACFTKNQKRWVSKPYTIDDISNFKNNLHVSGISAQHILAHSGYLINLGQPDEERRKISIDALIDEVNRCEQLGIDKLIFHPGSHLRVVTEEECLDYIAESINLVLGATNKVTLVVENTAGQGSNLGYKFEHLAHLISKTNDKTRIGVGIDTCHLFVSGYDFRTKEKYKKVWDQFHEIVGFGYLKGMHINDSKMDLGSSLDRHESIGKGKIGLEPFRLLMQDTRFEDMPLILETTDPTIWEQEIELLYDFCE